MENKDSSIFSGHGKAIFSEIYTSEVTMGKPNTDDEKKSTIEQENQEIEGNQRKIELNNLNPEVNPLGIKIGVDIGEVGKIQLGTDSLALETLEGRSSAGKSDASKKEIEIISLNSGLDEPILGNQRKGKSEKSTKSNNLVIDSGTEIGIQSTGIPKFNFQNQGKKIDSSRENLRKISPSTRHSMGSTGSSAITLGKGI